MTFNTDDELDYLVCGSCQQEFPLARFPLFVQHKKFDCDVNGTPTSLRCQSCPEMFYTPWKLLSHAQQAHNLQIYFMKSQLEEEQDHDADDDAETQGKENINPDGDGSHGQTPVKPSSNQAQDEEVREEYDEVIGDRVDGRGARDKVDGNDDEDLGDSVESAEMRGEGEEPAAEPCCRNQDCGIMVMPGTHEKPKKCCSAVVPKKRKQHMATKHKPNSKPTRKTSHHSAKPDTSASTIYIDLGPTPEGDLHIPASIDLQDGSPVSPESRTELHLTEDLSCPDSLPHSSKSTVIVQPGSTLSIPLYSTSQAGMPLICTMAGEPVLTHQSDRQGSKPVEMDTASKGSSSPPDALTSPGIQLNSQTSQVIDIVEASQTVPQIQHQSTVLLPEPGAKGEGLSNRQQTVQASADTYHSGMQMFNSRNTRKKRKYPTSRPFKCDMCDHSFNQRIHLKKHLSKHTGIKPFKCEQCDYSTVERSHLKVHIRVHTGEKPFKCTFCEYATAQNSTLKIHLKRHHNNAGVGVKCGMCQKSFVHQEELSQHLQSHQEEGNMTAFLVQKTAGSPDKQLGQVSNWTLLQAGLSEQSLSAMMSSLQTTEAQEMEPKRLPVTSQALSVPPSGFGRDFPAATPANPLFTIRN